MSKTAGIAGPLPLSGRNLRDYGTFASSAVETSGIMGPLCPQRLKPPGFRGLCCAEVETVGITGPSPPQQEKPPRSRDSSTRMTRPSRMRQACTESASMHHRWHAAISAHATLYPGPHPYRPSRRPLGRCAPSSEGSWSTPPVPQQERPQKQRAAWTSAGSP